MFASDVTPAPRPFAKKLADRHIVYAPNPAPGNKPIAAGHAYSVLACLPEKNHPTQAPWVLPLSVDRVDTSEKGHEVGPKRLRDLINNKTLAFKHALCVHVGDSAYFTLPVRQTTSSTNHLVAIARLRSNRKVYAPSTDSSKRKYDKKIMKLNKPATHAKPDQTVEIQSATSKNRPITVEIKVWRDRLFRGSREFKGHENPFNLHQIRVLDTETKKPLFKRPLWLAAEGERRHELDPKSVYESYRQRYDIEHFFRFGKQRLLMDDFRTPELVHEENWWQIVQLAYVQLYLSRDLCELIPNPWERYLPKFKQAPNEGMTDRIGPSCTQRNFAKVLEQIGTPAADVRKVKPGKGREQGETQVKRSDKPLLFKKKTPKNKQDEAKGKVKGSEKRQDIPKPEKIDDLIGAVRSWAAEMEISRSDLLLALEEALAV